MHTNQSKESFPKWFHESFWTHLMLIKKDENTYEMLPPNQLDWMFTLKYIDTDSVWNVFGKREDLNGLEEFKESYLVVES